VIKQRKAQMAHPNIINKLSPPKRSAVYDTYWKFASERQEIFFRRVRGEPPPWTNDPILLKHKFTNAYRASDRVTQYLIRNVIYQGDQNPDEVFFRCILFKIFNRESTWELFKAAFGEVRYSTYSFKQYAAILDRAKVQGDPIFSAAYIMPSGSGEFADPRKHRSYLALLERIMIDSVPLRLTEISSMVDAFKLLLAYPMLGNFLAYQFVIDLNYSAAINFSEMEFVVPGPGAIGGIRKCFTTTGDLSEADIIRFVADAQNEEFTRLGLKFRSLWGRQLQLIDCQNLFCEVDKYARVAHPEIKGVSGRTQIKQKFTASSQPIHYWFPPKWKLNDRTQKECKHSFLLASRCDNLENSGEIQST